MIWISGDGSSDTIYLERENNVENIEEIRFDEDKYLLISLFKNEDVCQEITYEWVDIDNCWEFSIRPLGEGYEIRLEPEINKSMCLTVHCPLDTKVEWTICS